ncbi:putative leucine-rich repeat domain superfamily [Helianthus anomalus]
MKSIWVFDWGFVTSGRMFSRFPKLIDVDLLLRSVISNKHKKWNISLGCEFGAFCIDSNVSLPNNLVLVPVSEVDLGLQSLCGFARYCSVKNLQILKLVGTVDGFYSSLVSDIGLTILAQGCKRLVKLELKGCK